MDVKEYVIALSVVCRPFRYLDTIKLAFMVSLVSVNCSSVANKPKEKNTCCLFGILIMEFLGAKI